MKAFDITIDKMVLRVCKCLMDTRGIGCVVSRREIIRRTCEMFNANPASVIPSDYCYNRTNDGITSDKPMVFEYLGAGKYRCLGSGFQYDGPVYHREYGSSSDIIVGQCIKGRRKLVNAL